MKPTIENLWNGNIAPGGNCGAGVPEIERMVMLMERHRERLGQELGQAQKAEFEKYTDCAEKYACLISAQAFCDGFCLASKLMAEALTNDM